MPLNNNGEDLYLSLDESEPVPEEFIRGISHVTDSLFAIIILFIVCYLSFFWRLGSLDVNVWPRFVPVFSLGIV